MTTDKWLSIETAPKDGTIVWGLTYSDLSIRSNRPDLERWDGKHMPIRHTGIADDGFDIGWSVALPVGHGGFPDGWFAGWQPLPPPPRSE